MGAPTAPDGSPRPRFRAIACPFPDFPAAHVALEQVAQLHPVHGSPATLHTVGLDGSGYYGLLGVEVEGIARFEKWTVLVVESGACVAFPLDLGAANLPGTPTVRGTDGVFYRLLQRQPHPVQHVLPDRDGGLGWRTVWVYVVEQAVDGRRRDVTTPTTEEEPAAEEQERGEPPAPPPAPNDPPRSTRRRRGGARTSPGLTSTLFDSVPLWEESGGNADAVSIITRFFSWFYDRYEDPLTRDQLSDELVKAFIEHLAASDHPKMADRAPRAFRLWLAWCLEPDHLFLSHDLADPILALFPRKDRGA